MGVVRFEKVLSTLPGTLTPDTLYMVRVGAGFDFYVSDSTGTVAHQINGTAANLPATVSQAEAEAGTATTERLWTAQRVAQAIGAIGGGGGVNSAVITTSDTPPTTPSDGDAWFNTSDATLSVYYQDADSGQWVVTSGPQGVPGADGLDGADTTVIASSTAPSNPEQGDLWFNTNDASMYFYDSGQWVAISGPTGPEGPEGPPGDGVSTGKAIAMAIVFG